MKTSLRRIVLLIVLLGAVFTAYSPALPGDFVWDDRNLVERPDSVHRLMPLHGYFTQTFWNPADHQRQDRSFYRPLVTMSYAVEWQLWKGRPSGFHLTNLLVHLLNCLLAFLLAKKWGARELPAAFGAALFGLLPRLAESVAWISGRTDTLAACFTLASLLAYPFPGPGDGRGRAVQRGGRAFAAGACILLGLLCKEVAAAGVAAILAAEAGFLTRRRTTVRRSLLRLTPVIAAVLVYAAARMQANGGGADGIMRRVGIGTLHHVALVLAAIGSYVRMAALFFMPEFQVGSTLAPPLHLTVLGALALACVGAAVIVVGPRRIVRSPAFPMAALGCGALGLVIHVVPLNIVCLAADRFLYVPAIAAAIGGAVAVSGIPADRLHGRALAAGAAVILLLDTWVVLGHSERWTGERSLFAWGCETASPRNAMGCTLLATRLIEDGMHEEALKAYDKTERLEVQGNPDMWQGYSRPRVIHGRALAMANLGRHRDAIDILRQADGMKSGNLQVAMKVPSLLAMELLRAGETAAARKVVRKRILPLAHGGRIAESFEALAKQVEGFHQSMGPDFGGPAASLSNDSLLLAIRLARLLQDNARLGECFVDLLERDAGDDMLRREALEHVVAKAPCSMAVPFLMAIQKVTGGGEGDPWALPTRCAAVDEGIFQ